MNLDLNKHLRLIEGDIIQLGSLKLLQKIIHITEQFRRHMKLSMFTHVSWYLKLYQKIVHQYVPEGFFSNQNYLNENE